MDKHAYTCNTLTCINCGGIIKNISPVCSNGGHHRLDVDRFEELKEEITKEYLKDLQVKENNTEENLKLYINMFLKDSFTQEIMDGVKAKEEKENEDNMERAKLVKNYDGEAERKFELDKFNSTHPPCFMKLIGKTVHMKLNQIENRDDLIEEESIKEMINTVSEQILCDSLFQFGTTHLLNSYIERITNVSFTGEHEELRRIIHDAFELSVIETIRDSDENIRIDAIMSVNKLEEVVRNYIIRIIIDENPDANEYFNEQLNRYIENKKYGYLTFHMIIKHFVGVKLLNAQEAHLYAPSTDIRNILGEQQTSNRSHYTDYVYETMRMLDPHNLDYGFNIPEIYFRYQYIVSAHEGAREGIKKIRRRGKDIEMYDFLQLYKNIKLDSTIKWIVHKEKEMVRIRTLQTIENTNTEEHNEHFSVYFDGDEIAKHADKELTSFEDCSASFDLYTSKCYLTGTTEQIQWMVDFFDKYGYRLESPLFKSFKGMMVVTSKAVYSKRIFQSLLRFKTFADYWFTKGNTTSNNNFLFMFKEHLSKTISTNEYVQLNIQHLGKLSMLDNEWKFSFEGNRHDYLVPFVSMLLCMIHFTSNLTYNERFREYVNYERIALSFYTDKTVRNNTRKSTDISLVSVAQRTITKKDVYNDSIAMVPRTAEERLSYSGRSKPFLIHYFTSEDKETMEKWRKFFTEAAKKQNKLLIKRNTPQSNIKRCAIEFTAERIKMIVYTANGTRHVHEIGARYASVDGTVEYFITYYPEKSNVYSIINHNDIWLRRAAISEKVQSAYRIAQSVRLRVNIPAQTENVTKQFTNEPIRKISFFEPYGLVIDETPKEHLLKYYGDESVIIALCKQHMWDHSDSEIIDSLNEFDMKKHQDLIQNYMQTTVLYFEYNDKERKYELAFPRHKYWYSYNHHYKHVTFVFKNSKQMYEVIYFGNMDRGQKHSDFRRLHVSKLISPDQIQKYVKTFNITGTGGYIKRSQDIGEKIGDEDQVVLYDNAFTESHDITYQTLLQDIPVGWSLDGQMFDSNGKSVGVRVYKREDVVDLRYAPQFPIMESYSREEMCREMRGVFKSLRVVTDSQTTSTRVLKGRLPSYYSIIPKRTRRVKYDIGALSTEYEKRRQMLYTLSRMIITHWMIKKFYSSDEELDVEEYLEYYIRPHAQDLVAEQRIENIVIPMYFEDLEKYTDYLNKVIPNYFHKGDDDVPTFRVDLSDVISFRQYMKRELEILVNMNEEFYTAFANARMHTIVSATSEDEIIDMKNIQELQTAYNIKKYLVDQKNYLFSAYFSQNFDINTKALKESTKTAMSDKLVISKNTTTKTELLITKVNGVYYMIRFTNNGELETAVYICNIWKKYKKICSFWETESMLGSKRMFEVVENTIVESHTNNLVELSSADQDYHILRYKRDNKPVFAAMLPFSS